VELTDPACFDVVMNGWIWGGVAALIAGVCFVEFRWGGVTGETVQLRSTHTPLVLAAGIGQAGPQEEGTQERSPEIDLVESPRVRQREPVTLDLFLSSGATPASISGSPLSNGEAWNLGFRTTSEHRSFRKEEAALMTLDELIQDLHDDDIRWNAAGAFEELRSRATVGNEKVAVSAALDRALYSNDTQQGDYALGLLFHLAEGCSDEFVPSEKMLEATAAAALLDESLRYWTDAVDSRQILRFVLEYKSHMLPYLRRAAHRGGSLIPFNLAYVLGMIGSPEDISLVAGTLVEHLRDNHTANDALRSLEALYHMGPGVMPWVEGACYSFDEQQAACAQLLKVEFIYPATTKAERVQRQCFNKVSTLYHDPVQEYHFVRPRP
jgi:hypothetical protein